jgi:chromosome segregation ATPase
MATAAGRNRCVTCEKVKATSRCGGCLQEFCYNDFGHHRQELNKQLDEVEVTRDLFRQTLTDQTTDPQKHSLIQQINDWERDSIKKIRQTAEEARQTLIKHTIEHIGKVELDLTKLTDQLRQSREEDDFFETDLLHWNEELTRLTKELAKPSNVNLRQNSTSLINKISVDITSGKCISHA